MAFSPFDRTFTASAPNSSGIGNWWNQNGEGVMGGLSAITGLANLFGAFQSLGLQRDAFSFEKDKFNRNFANQVKAYENELRDQWFARSGAMATLGQEYMSEDSFLAQRGLTGEMPPNRSASRPQTPPSGNTGNTPSDDNSRRRRAGVGGGG